MRLPLILALPFLTFGNLTNAQENPATPDVLFILDGSGSMWGRIDEVEKIIVAKEVMTGLVAGLPDEIDAGLITYGHRERGSCSDIEVIATPGQTSRDELLSSLAGITPLGKTPISDSLLRAGEVLRTTEDPVSVVLVSDGIESCEGDPCATAALLREQDIDVRIHVVGFDVDEEARAQLSCIAQAGGGEYYQASSADALNDALSDVRVSIVQQPVAEPDPEPVFTNPNIRLAADVIGGVDVINTATGEILLRLAGENQEEVPPGSFQFSFDNFLSPALPIEANQDYVISAAQFGLSVIQLDGTQLRNVDVVIEATGEKLTYLSGTMPQLFPAGSYIFEFENFASPPVAIGANEMHVISPSDFAPAQVAMDGTQLKNVRVIDTSSGAVVTMLSSTQPERILPGTYQFRFANFTSPLFVIEGDGNYVISPSDYGLALVAMDGNQLKNVVVLDPQTNETIASLSSDTPQYIPPGTYRFKFSNFTSADFTVDPGGDYTISPSDYGLSQVAMDGTQEGGVNVVVAETGETLTRLSGTTPKQIPPGTYHFAFDHYRSAVVNVEDNQNYTISPADYGLATVRLAERVGDPFLLLQGGQDPINMRDGREKQIGPGPYAMVYDGVELGILNVEPGETRVIQVGQ